MYFENKGRVELYRQIPRGNFPLSTPLSETLCSSRRSVNAKCLQLQLIIIVPNPSYVVFCFNIFCFNKLDCKYVTCIYFVLRVVFGKEKLYTLSKLVMRCQSIHFVYYSQLLIIQSCKYLIVYKTCLYIRTCNGSTALTCV